MLFLHCHRVKQYFKFETEVPYVSTASQAVINYLIDNTRQDYLRVSFTKLVLFIDKHLVGNFTRIVALCLEEASKFVKFYIFATKQ